MNYATVCSGIEAPSVAWEPLGWKPQWFSEIERFPSQVLAHHYPSVPNLGDMTTIHQHPHFQHAAIDLLCGGTPCQSFSVAGLRKGLADPRGNLMLTFLALAAAKRPHWILWENVPGVLSSNGGRDFGTFLGALAELGYGWAYRVLDAQYFGVAQRRRRVFVVGCLGSQPGAASVLFERYSLSGHPAPSRETKQGVAGTITSGSSRRRRAGIDPGELVAYGGNNTSGPIQVSTALNASSSASGRLDFESETFVTAPLTTRPYADNEANESQLVAVFDANQIPSKTNRPAPTPELCHTLSSSVTPPVAFGMAVRRLTPIECERLQGFPDGYTDIQPNGKRTADGPRYKALGNSMAVPVVRMIGQRIQLVNDILP